MMETYSQTLDERGENERHSENDLNENVNYRSEGQKTDKSWCKQD